jgi:uncharacterized protein
MWQKISSLILRKREIILVIIGLATIFMGYRASQVQIRYDFALLLPPSDSTSIQFMDFKNRFGEDGNVLLIGIQDERLFELERFQHWYDLTHEILADSAITDVMSIARTVDLIKNDSLKKFEAPLLIDHRPTTQAEVDNLKNRLNDLPIYDGLLITKGYSTLLAATLSDDVLDSKERIAAIKRLSKIGEDYEQRLGSTLHFSGLPFIRSVISQMVSKELGMFLILAGAIAALIMFVFFRSVKVVFFSILVVAIGVTWAFGTMNLLGYKLSILFSL